MQTPRLKASDRRDLERAAFHGVKWRGCYWRSTFDFNGKVVAVAAVPPYLLGEIERGATTIERVSRMLARQSVTAGVAGPCDFDEYCGLWDEAVSYALGVREDARYAADCGRAALDAVRQESWFAAVEYAYRADAYERLYVEHGRYWMRLLHTLTDFLVRSGHGHIHPYLHPRAHPRTPAPLHGSRRRSPSRRHDRRRGPRSRG